MMVQIYNFGSSSAHNESQLEPMVAQTHHLGAFSAHDQMHLEHDANLVINFSVQIW